MQWFQFATLLMQFGERGFDLAQKLNEKWNSPAPVTPEDINECRELGKRTPRQAMEEALARAGIALGSDKAKELLALVPE